ncbi:hypothetical protein LMB39_11260 [Limosilactobacillus reuteri]|uniref:hypothetical protein n=1 Tax=Limosilactobacillus reuteri TaxID=1598 RepID=UPI001E2989E0|nr:hypothetical protein [Limosilactobacillus reuteri]MCC4346998.1 hypothetical protein [Limosilactobacillus reuteri]MCC4373943.1 hypothetical protein [Limosilactobacillus reuteri]MCC4386471.1 hypothetical protein [Limosilactobacillus reuteri]
MNNEVGQIKSAVEKVTGHKFDALVVLGANKQTGLALQSIGGKVALIATLIAALYEKYPQLESMVNDAEQLKKGQVPDDLVKALFNILGGNSND